MHKIKYITRNYVLSVLMRSAINVTQVWYKLNKVLSVWKTKRYLLNKEDMFNWIELIVVYGLVLPGSSGKFILLIID